MKKVVLAVLTLVPALAFAAPGAYVQAGAGLSYVDSGSSDISNFYGFAGQAGAGYLWGDNTVNYGLEADVTSYPDSTTTQHGEDLKINGYNLSLLGVLKYTDCSSGVVAFAKAGATYVDQKATVTVPGLGSASASANTVAPEGALGVGYLLNQNVELDLTGDYVYTGNGNNGPQNNGSVLLGLTYHFA